MLGDQREISYYITHFRIKDVHVDFNIENLWFIDRLTIEKLD